MKEQNERQFWAVIESGKLFSIKELDGLHLVPVFLNRADALAVKLMNIGTDVWHLGADQLAFLVYAEEHDGVRLMLAYVENHQLVCGLPPKRW